jgi:hypothetical protein
MIHLTLRLGSNLSLKVRLEPQKGMFVAVVGVK